MKIYVENLKCGGCRNSIKAALESAGFKNVDVSIADKSVSFSEGDINKARKILSKLGYPEKGSQEAKSLIKKGISYISCSIGKLKK